MTGCGYTPAEIDDMTWWDVEALCAYWREYPPPHEALKVGFGLEVRAAPEAIPAAPGATAADPSGIGGLIAQFPNGLVPADR